MFEGIMFKHAQVFSLIMQIIAAFPSGPLQDVYGDTEETNLPDHTEAKSRLLSYLDALQSLLGPRVTDLGTQTRLLRWAFAEDGEQPLERFSLDVKKRSGGYRSYYNTIKNCLRSRLNPSLRDICEEILHV